MRRSSFVHSTAVALLIGCASPPPPPPPAPARAAAAKPVVKDDVVGPPQVAWAELTKEQRGKFMKKVVLPRMQPIFAAFDADEFAELKCSTCHGHDPRGAGYKMPSPELPELPTTHEGFLELAQKKPKMVAFMKEQVMPQMAALLGQRPFDPARPQQGGFGCMNCHPAKQ